MTHSNITTHSGIIELRQYTLGKGRGDGFIKRFCRLFWASQEAVGAHVLGCFTDLDDPDRFVWLRGFETLETRFEALDAFYSGPVWQENRNAANADIIDSDNVLLLQPHGAFALPPGPIALLILYRDDPAPDRPALVTHPGPNTYPRLPIRENETVVIHAMPLAEAAAPTPEGRFELLRLAPCTP